MQCERKTSAYTLGNAVKLTCVLLRIKEDLKTKITQCINLNFNNKLKQSAERVGHSCGCVIITLSEFN